MHSIAVAGHLCLDLAPHLSRTADLEPGRLVEVGALSVTLGGSVANTGGALTGLGADVIPFASIGDDELGMLLLARLRAEGFTEPQLSVSRGSSTSYSLVIEKPEVDRTFWHHTGANDDFDGTSVEVTGRALLHVGYPSLLPGMLVDGGRPLHALLHRARAAGATTSIDLAVVDRDSTIGALDWSGILSHIFAECDIASPSLDDLTSALRIDQPYSASLVAELADRILADGVAVVAISAGHHGLHVRTASAERLHAGGSELAPLADSWANRSLTLDPLAVDNPVTTSGAGDASTAGLLFAITRGASLEQAAALATACSAVVISGGVVTPATVNALNPALATLFA